ncbi:MAG: hypothetical protein JW925_00755 [Syntrophaceae bacterium]|nr:hypothetical protein [Syntrophaceae bacterium]
MDRKERNIFNSISEEHSIKKNLKLMHVDRGAGKKRTSVRILFAALLICSTLFVYFPSINVVFINDQLSYFLELDGETSLGSGFQLLDYGAQRQYNKGDEVLYRPLLFTFLAVENSLLKRNFKLWNLANICLHILVVFLLFTILWRINYTSLAFGFALLFGLLMSNFALVTLHHLGGYLIGYGLLLIALWAAREMASDRESIGLRWFRLYGCAMTGAMLLHEIAVIASLAVIAYVGWCRRRQFNTESKRYIVALGVPVLFYAMLYSFHVWQCERFLWIDTHGANNSPIEYLLNIFLLIVYWLQHIFLPVSGQMVFSYMHFSSWSLDYGKWIPHMIVPGFLWIVVLICIGRGFERKHFKESLPFAMLISFLIVSYAGINVFGRSSHALQISHYDYFPALFGAVLLYSLVDFSKVRSAKKTLALVCLFLLAFYNGLEIRKNSRLVHEMYKPVASYLELVEREVRQKLSRSDFSFFIKAIPPELDIRIKGGVGYPDQGNVVEMHLLRALYGKYYNSENPMELYVIKKIQPDKLDLLVVK